MPNVTDVTAGDTGFASWGHAVYLDITDIYNVQLPAKLSLSGGTLTGTLIASTIKPSADNTYTLGVTGTNERWAAVASMQYECNSNVIVDSLRYFYGMRLHLNTSTLVFDENLSLMANAYYQGTLWNDKVLLIDSARNADFATLKTGGTQRIDGAGNLDNINSLDIGVTNVVTSARELINVAGLAHDATPRKLVTLYNSWNGIMFFFNFNATSGTYGAGATGELTYSLGVTVPGTVFNAQCTVKCVTAGQTGATFTAHVTALSATSITIRYENNTGISVPAADAVYMCCIVSQL